MLLTILMLFGTAAALAILRAVRPRFRFGWLLAIGTTTAAWLSALLWVPQLPVTLSIPLWHSAASANSFASFIVTDLTWPLAFSLLTLALSILLTAPARQDFPNSSNWSVCLTIVGIGLLASTAEGPLTLVLFWAGLDLVEAGALLARLGDRSLGRGVSFSFASRLASLALVLLALVLSRAQEGGTGFAEVKDVGSWLLPAAALLRLAAFGVPWPTERAFAGSGEVDTTLRLVAGAASVAFLPNLNLASAPDSWLILGACAVLSLFGAWMWLRAPDIRSGQSMWILGIGSLAVAAALRGSDLGAAAWGSAMLLAGSGLFLLATNERWLSHLAIAGIWLCSGLPFSLTATGWTAAAGGFDWILPALLIAQGMLLAGYMYRALRPEIGLASPEAFSSLRGVYRVGVVLPLVVGILLGIGGWPGAFQFGAPVAGVATIVTAIAALWAKQRVAALNPAPAQWMPVGLLNGWTAVEIELDRLLKGVRRIVEGITRTLEGEAGMMWSLMLLVLLVSLIASRGK